MDGVSQFNLLEISRYVDILNGIFAKGRKRTDELNCMVAASGVAARYEITSFSSGRDAEFKQIEVIPRIFFSF